MKTIITEFSVITYKWYNMQTLITTNNVFDSDKIFMESPRLWRNNHVNETANIQFFNS